MAHSNNAVRWLGTSLALLGSSVVAASNVFCEWLVKRHPRESLHKQNIQLYWFGVAFNSLTLLVKYIFAVDTPIHMGFLHGYSGWVWLIIFANSVSGLLVSAVLKFLDNIAVVISHALSLFVVTLVSALFFELE